MQLSDQFAQACFERLSFNSPLNCSASTLCPSNSLGRVEILEELEDAKLRKIIQFKVSFDVWRIRAIIQVTSFHGLFLRHIFVLPAKAEASLKKHLLHTQGCLSHHIWLTSKSIYPDLIQMKSDVEVSKIYKRTNFMSSSVALNLQLIFLPVFIIIILNRHD